MSGVVVLYNREKRGGKVSRRADMSGDGQIGVHVGGECYNTSKVLKLVSMKLDESGIFIISIGHWILSKAAHSSFGLE